VINLWNTSSNLGNETAMMGLKNYFQQFSPKDMLNISFFQNREKNVRSEMAYILPSLKINNAFK
jgi:hypothetical protein